MGFVGLKKFMVSQLQKTGVGDCWNCNTLIIVGEDTIKAFVF
jgi:hypothetical protein